MAAIALFWLIFLYAARTVVTSYSLDYKGFDNCGIGGWHCNNNETDFHVSYDCDNSDVRLWLWTARIPSKTTVYEVKNCRNVELHFDCTMGYRAYTLRQFRVTNVDMVDILQPLRPHIFLHDNDEVAHAPPDLVFSNVRSLNWFPKTFEKATNGRCRTKQKFLRDLAFHNVVFPSLERNAFSNGTLDTFLMKNVKVAKLEGNAIVLAASRIEISNSIFRDVPNEAFKLEADKVVIRNNEFGSISSNGINAKAQMFQFSNNKVGVLKEFGFNTLAREHNITGNKWMKLATHALRGIAPGERMTQTYALAEKFTYTFSSNEIVEIEENSLQPNYQAFKRVCSSLIVESNSLPCTCNLPFEDPDRNRRREWWQHFYGELVLTESNHCTLAPNCSLQQTLKVLQQQACSESLHPEAICVNITASYYTPTLDPALLTTTTPSTLSATFSTPTTVPDHINQSANSAYASSQSSLITMSVVSAIVLMGILLGIMGYSYKRMKASTLTMDTTYRQQRSVDEDDDEEGLISERFQSAIGVNSE